MDKTQKSREEIDNKYKWDLTLIYKSDEDWYNDLNTVDKEIEKISDFKGVIVKSAKNLLDYLEFSLILSETKER